MRYIRPPEVVVTQIDVYTEEKFEDEEELRERTRSVFKGRDEGEDGVFEVACRALDDITGRYESLKPTMVDLLERMGSLMGKEITL